VPTSTMYRTRTEWSGLPGFPGLQTLYWAASAGSAQAAVDELAASYTGAASLIDNSLDWVIRSDVEEVDPTTGQVTGLISVTGATDDGSQAAAAMSLGTQGLVWLRTGVWRNGREVRGRFYLPGVCTSGNDQGTPSSTYQTGILAAVTALVDQASVNLVVYSPSNSEWLPIEALVISPYWARLRSRQR
jgi:hypothetical protein